MSYDAAIGALREARSIVLATHINPDADTLGSALGLYHALRSEGKRVTVVNVSQIPYNLHFLPGITKIKKELPKEFDLLVALDAGSFERLGIEPVAVPILNIDHHISNERYGTIDLIEPDFIATAQVVHALLRQGDFSIPKESAMALYTALVDDSGFFRYERVDARVFECAADLCKRGAAPYQIAKALTMQEPLAKLCLIQKLLATLELVHFAKIGYILLRRSLLLACGASKEMGEAVLEMVRSLATVEVAILLREEEDGAIKVSLRSKDFVDVSKIAVEFGGGGHPNAAGFTQKAAMEEVLAKVLERVKKEIVVET